MDKFNFVKDGAVKLPPGFRFQPSDKEIVFHYLARKVFSFPLPASIIPEISVYKYNPWDLPAGDCDSQQERYLFCKKEAKYRNGHRANRATGAGYWRAAGRDKQIRCPRGQSIIGMKKTLVFYRGKRPHVSRTTWIMHEYRLVAAHSMLSNNYSQGSLIQVGDWVLCRIFKKNTSQKTEDETMLACKDDGANIFRAAQPRYYHFVTNSLTNLSPATSSIASSFSDPSAITDTEATSSNLDFKDSSSSNGWNIVSLV